MAQSKKDTNEFLGESYNYFENIKTPAELGVGSSGTWNQLSKNVNGLFGYVDVLLTGNSKASRTGGPLGNRFTMNTGMSCKDVRTGKLVDRYTYFDNIPDGRLKFMTTGEVPLQNLQRIFLEKSGGSTEIPVQRVNEIFDAMDVPRMSKKAISEISDGNVVTLQRLRIWYDENMIGLKDFRGLIPGSMKILDELNPTEITDAIVEGANPLCMKVGVSRVDKFNEETVTQKHLTLKDICRINESLFRDESGAKVSRPAGVNCKVGGKWEGTPPPDVDEEEVGLTESFTTKNIIVKDPMLNVYFTSISLFSLYMLYSIFGPKLKF